MGGKIFISVVAVAAALALTAAESRADIIHVKYEVKPTSTPGYSASWLHTASGSGSTGSDGNTYYMSGTKTHSLSGTLYATIDTSANGGLGSITFTGGTITATKYSNTTIFGETAESTTIDIDGSTFDVESDGGTLRPEGYLTGTFDPGGDGASKDTDVSFYFAPISHSGSANSISADLFTITLWGNNWDETTGAASSNRAGIDLYLVGTAVVPEPSTIALMSLGAIGLVLQRRRRMKVAAE